MAGLGGTDFNNAMKTLYMDPLNDQVFRATPLLNRINKNSKDVSGNEAYIPLITGRNPGVGSRTEPASSTGVGAKLPPAGRQSYDKLTFKMVMHYGHGSVSGGIKRKSRNKEGAFAQALDTEMQGLMKSLPDDLNRQLCSDGSGRAGDIGANVTKKTTCAVPQFNTFHMRVGDRIHASRITTSMVGEPHTTAATVASIDFNQDASGTASALYHKVTTSTLFTATAATDALYFGEIADATDVEGSSYAQELLGICALVDDGDIGANNTEATGCLATDDDEIAYGTIANAIGGIDRDVTPIIQSTVKGNSGTLRPLTLSLMQEAWLTSVAQNGVEAEAVEIWMDPSVWGTLGMLIAGGRVYTNYVKTVEMGFRYIEFNGTKCWYDRDLPAHQMFFLGMNHIMLLTQNDYELLDDDGRVVRMAGSGTRDAWSFVVNRDAQGAINNGRAHTRLRDISTTMDVMGALH